jgi:hypothetical protein
VFEAPPPPARPPRSVIVVAILLVVVGLGAAFVGLAASAISGCCGDPDGADSTPAVIGLGVAGAAALSGVLLWLGSMSRWVILAPAAAVPVACLAAAPSSSDLAGLAPLAVVGWVVLAVFVSRGRAARWLAADRDPPS